MNKPVKTIGLAAVLALGAESAQASSGQSQLLQHMQPGVYYKLTPAAAAALDIDLNLLVAEVRLQNSQSLVFQAFEDGEINLSIYENGAFNSLKADIVK